MSDYRPDKWVIIEILNGGDDPLYKVFGSWLGGYLGSDSWRSSSGITKIDTPDEDGWMQIHNLSGSIYWCYKDSYGTSFYAQGVLDNMIANKPEYVRIRIIDKDEVFTLDGVNYGTKNTTGNG